LWAEIVTRAFPGATSNHHLGTQLAMLGATIEMNAFKSAYHPSGIRMGVQEMTRFGMKEPDFDNLARFIADVVLRKKNIAADVAEFRSNFLAMGYCLTAEQTIRLGSRIFESMLPKTVYSSVFPKL
jgi:glycine/serine hydroxymethyltransferase